MKSVTINEQKEVFEFNVDGSYKRYLDYDAIVGNCFLANNIHEIQFQESSSPEHQERSEQILRSIEQGNPFPQGVYDISAADMPTLQLYGMPLPKSRENPMVITKWHLKADMRIYQGENLYSSRIRAVEGNIVYTESGSYYLLAGRDPAIRNIQNLLAPRGSPNDVYNSLNPLTPKSIAQLLLAEMLVYGKAKNCASLLLSALQETECLLVSSNLSDSNPFEAIRDILRSIGISVETIPSVPLSPPLFPPLLDTPPRTAPAPPHIVNIGHSLQRGSDVLTGFPFTVSSNISLRELFLRMLMKHPDIFSSHLNNIEPFDGNLRLEWCLDVQGDQVVGGWTPYDPEAIDKQLNLEYGEKKLGDLQFVGSALCRILFRS
jgi:hypothetical protein